MKRSILLSILTFYFCSLLSQRTCIIKEDIINASVMSETGAAALLPDIIIIPVVVHIIYNTPAQNISNEQVKSQIAVLNQDFRKKNPDASYIPNAFKSLAADSRIEFRLATSDPSGLPVYGIRRIQTTAIGFGADDKIKSGVSGGDDAWDRNQYLNIWVGNLSGGIMGYASSPGCTSEKDGVVIHFNAFGTTGNIKSPFNKGRTTVHEVGHWLGLRHIWGDADCGDDRIDDTPPQQGPTRGCPSGVVATCTSGAAGNMYMNFMDFTNDECTHMFTMGQAAKMRGLFASDGARTALLSSDKALGTPIEESFSDGSAGSKGLTVFPNPASGQLNIRFNNLASNKEVIIYNNIGQVSKRFQVTGEVTLISIKNLRPGMYFISANGEKVVKFLKSEN